MSWVDHLLMNQGSGLADPLRYVANLEGGMKGLERIGFRQKFVADVEIVSSRRNCIANAAVVQFLAIIEIAAARNSRCMKMPDPSDGLANGAHDISFHDLHVV